MSQVAQVPLYLLQGASYRRTFRFGVEPYVYKAITGASKTAPASLTVTSHGIPDGWPIWVESVQGMDQINRPRTCQPYTKTRVVDANTIELNDVNALEYDTYSGSGVVIYMTPVSLAGATAKLQVRQQVSSVAALITLTSSPAAGIVVDDTAKTISIEFSAAQLSGLAIPEGVYDLELTFSDGSVRRLAEGSVFVSREVTRP